MASTPALLARTACGPQELVERLALLNQNQHGPWALCEGMLEKVYRFEDFHATMAFVNAVADVAHFQNHHPVLTVTYDQCLVRLTTHDAGGISPLDFAFASTIDALLGSKPPLQT